MVMTLVRSWISAELSTGVFPVSLTEARTMDWTMFGASGANSAPVGSRIWTLAANEIAASEKKAARIFFISQIYKREKNAPIG